MRKVCTEVDWFESYEVGDEFFGEPVEFTEEEIIDFAGRYGPQPYHIDREAAKASQFGGIIASGCHTISAVWGSVMRAGFMNGRGMGGPGITNLFRKPVRPGDTLTALIRVCEKRASQSRSDRGYVSFEFETTNQNGEIVMTQSCQQIIPTRPK
jgi:acyl dehydratase